MPKDQTGLIIVLTGEGKGKSSSAFGMLLRAVGWQLKVCVVQFIKGSRPTGEQKAAQTLPGVTWHTCGEGFTWLPGDPDRHQRAADKAWALSQQVIQSSAYDLVILDEINYALGYGWLDSQQVADFIRSHKPASQNLILTGRNAPAEIIALAHTVTRMEAVKHAFDAGIQAKRGIEY